MRSSFRSVSGVLAPPAADLGDAHERDTKFDQLAHTVLLVDVGMQKHPTHRSRPLTRHPAA
jgi:hypothetical protein